MIKVINVLEEEKEVLTTSDNVEDFCNLIICLTSVARKAIQSQNLSENDRETINAEKEKIISAIGKLADTLELEKDFAEENITTEKKKSKQKKKPILKENVIVSNLSEDVISNLKFYNIIDRINTIKESYSKICADLTYDQNNKIYLDLIKIENILTDVESTVACELNDVIEQIK